VPASEWAAFAFPLDPYHEQIKAHLQSGLSVAAIQKLINRELEEPLTYNSYKYFIARDEALRACLSRKAEN
jgi:hypothetical protein